MCPQRACTIPTFGSREVRQQTVQEVCGRQEIGVENGDVAAAGDLQPGFERAGLVTGAVGSMEVLDVDALRRMPPDGQLRDLAGFVGRVVQNLNFEQLPRVVEAADGLNQPVGDVHLVVDRELNRDDRQRVERRRFGLVGNPYASCKDTRGSSDASRTRPECSGRRNS